MMIATTVSANGRLSYIYRKMSILENLASLTLGVDNTGSRKSKLQ